jgi:signal transduction histidine kinase
MNVLRRGRSISARLTRMNLMVGGLALVLACASFFGYDLLSFRQSLIGSLATESQIIGANTVSALTFDDQQAATATLSALRNAPHVIAAAVFTSDGVLFASYTREGHAAVSIPPRLAPGEMSARWSEGSNILVGSRIAFRGQSIGTVYILAETSEVLTRAKHYAAISAFILMLCLLCALVVTSHFRRLLASPLIDLAQTARVVTVKKDYSTRARDDAGEVEEVSVLVSSFNEMLGQIEERDRALQQAKEELEKRVEERTAELRAANKELEAFSYSVAHDLRGPLDVIGNIGYLLQHTAGPLDEASRELVEQLLLGTRRMSGLINDLLHLSRATSTGLHTGPIDLSEMAQSIADDLQQTEPERSVEFRIARGARVIADKNLLRVALENLLGNAWKYTSKLDRTLIEFGVSRNGGDCVYFVRDNGAGFDPHFADRLFEPFQRLHTQKEFPGTGIGLATVERIIGRHGGRVWAEGQVDRGATIYFTLPEGRVGEGCAAQT